MSPFRGLFFNTDSNGVPYTIIDHEGTFSRTFNPVVAASGKYKAYMLCLHSPSTFGSGQKAGGLRAGEIEVGEATTTRQLQK